MKTFKQFLLEQIELLSEEKYFTVNEREIIRSLGNSVKHVMIELQSDVEGMRKRKKRRMEDRTKAVLKDLHQQIEQDISLDELYDKVHEIAARVKGKPDIAYAYVRANNQQLIDFKNKKLKKVQLQEMLKQVSRDGDDVWAFMDKKGKRVLAYYDGPKGKKPSEEWERKQERRVQYFKHSNKKNISEDYRGEHRAAGKEGAPLHDLTHNEVYPKDYYDRWSEYAQTPEERDAALVVNGYRNKPNKQIMIYRAVPHTQTKEERIDALEDAQRMWMRRNKVHPDFEKEYQKLGDKKYYDWLWDEKEKVMKSDDKVENINDINPGDWVTIVRKYAKQHGQDNLNNKFRILSKKVKAKDIFTDGNSLAEWGYVP